MHDGLREYNCAGSGMKKQQRQEPMTGYRQNHALYVLREKKNELHVNVLFLWKNVFLFHMIGKLFFAFLLTRKNILT